MKKIINVALNFSEKQICGVSPVVKSVHLYPLSLGGLGNFTKHNSWALEYHSKDAGFIELRNEPGKWQKRKANSVHLYAPGCCYREDTREANLTLEENYFLLTSGEKCGFEHLIDPDLLLAILTLRLKRSSIAVKYTNAPLTLI